MMMLRHEDEWLVGMCDRRADVLCSTFSFETSGHGGWRLYCYYELMSDDDSSDMRKLQPNEQKVQLDDTIDSI